MLTTRTRPAGDSFMLSPEAETLPREALTALQLPLLRRTLEHAYRNVPHYRRSFDAAGVRPEDLRSLDDLAAFPFA